MTFVLVACRENNRASARLLAAKLAAKKLDVCSDLEQAPGEVCAGAYRMAIDHGALLVALWSQDDHADSAYLDHLLYAQRNDRLFAVAVADARLPGILGSDPDVAGVLEEQDAQKLETLLSSIASRASGSNEEGEFDENVGSVAKETKAFLRVQRRRNANALVRYLREYPAGVFEQLVREQLDEETRPHYQADRQLAGGWFGALSQRLRLNGAEGGAEDDSPTQVWRVEASPWSAGREMFSSIAGYAKSPLSLGIGGVILVGALGIAGLNLIDWPRAQSMRATVAVAPREADADAQTRDLDIDALPPSLSTSALGSEVAPPSFGSIETASQSPIERDDNSPPGPVQRREISPPPATSAVEDHASSAAAAEQLAREAAARQTESRAQSEARAIQLARRQDTVAGYNAYLSAFPAGASASEARSARDALLQGPPAFDLAQLEPNDRALVQRARAGEAGGSSAAARSRRAIVIRQAGGNDAQYRGEHSGGVANGLGRANWPNGDVYAGPWSGSRPNGFGVLRLADGARYEGEFSGGAPTGRGVFWNAEGRRLVGDRLFAALVRARSQ